MRNDFIDFFEPATEPLCELRATAIAGAVNSHLDTYLNSL